MTRTRQWLASIAGVATAIAGVTVLAPPPAQAAGPGLVINEVYGGGNNGGATYRNDFIELRNTSASTINLNGKSLQYRATGGTGASTNVFSLPNIDVPAGETFLVAAAGGTTNGVDLPTADATSTINLSGTAGQIYLANSATGIDPGTGNIANASVIDFVGWGAATTSYESAPAPGTNNTSSVTRDAAGADTDNNGADFTAASGAAMTPSACGGDCGPPPPPPCTTIAEIQGTDSAVSPCAGQTVTVSGVVTAVYPTGGFDGFYLQTGGTGGGTDATPGASDAIFVFGQNFDESTLPLGDTVSVTGVVSEFNGLTEITVANPTDVDTTVADQPAVTAWSAAYPTTAAAREAHEGELLAPTNTFTVSNSFATNQFGEVGLATGTTPLLQPSDVARPGTPAYSAAVDDNAARAVTLDDGSTLNFLNAANQGVALPWLSATTPVRVGATATIKQPVILDFRNNAWKFQPRSQITATTDDAFATFANTRVAQPRNVGGDVKLATFNVLNYFNTTGEAYNATHPGACTSFNDRQGNPIAVNTCTPTGPRGAWNAANLTRQQDKIVRAINNMDADIVSLEEIENSIALGETDRDDAVSALVNALNAQAGFTRWAFAPSPAVLPALAEQDVIRTAFIFNPDTVSRVGQSQVLVGSAPFSNAREPLAQAFKAEGAPDAEAFAVVVNHFKSKSCSGATGDNADTGDGQSCFNGDRTRQAQALVTFANDFAASRGTQRIFLTGDFNSYTEEDPMHVLYNAGFDVVESDQAGDWSYSFSGLSGSLDHVLANSAGMAMKTGADVWEINANESPAYQYSRFNYNVTNLYAATPYGASDHNPEIVGLDTSVPPPPRTIQVLGTNDFHGRINRNATGAEAGAAVLAGAVKQLRAANPDTVFAAAGDLIGASTFESFILKDKPTIDALNEAGLEVSSVGNHEFDQGYNDLVNRVMAAYDVDDNPYGGAEWKYLGANIKFRATGNPALPATWIKNMNGIQVGFVGAVTEHLPELVSPGGISQIEVTDIVDATNEEADNLKAAGADIVILLVHEGAATTSYASATDPDSDFGEIVNGVNENVDAIISGHTHLAYNHRVPVAEWAAEGRSVTKRPVVSSGQYGYNLNRLRFRVDPVSGDVVGIQTSILALQSNDGTGSWSANYPADPATTAIVTAANNEAGVLGGQELGKIGGPFNRAKLSNGTTENRGGESTLGNLVAEVQRWATPDTVGGAQIAFMNPGGLRQDMVGVAGGYPATLTYKQAAEVQPFANTLVNMDLTGAQIKSTLEQQWQPAGSARPFLRLGASEGFDYTYDANLPVGSRITGMWLDGTPISLTATYAVTVNSFLATGGDNFFALAGGTNKQDTGMTDLQAMVEYLGEFANTASGDPALPVDATQHAVGVRFPGSAPATYAPGDQVLFDLTSLAMSTAPDPKDTEVEVSLGGSSLGTFAVNNTIGTDILDEYGTASVDVTVPAGTPDGTATLLVTGATTGTVVRVPITVAGGGTPTPTPTPSPTQVATTVTGSAAPYSYGASGSLAITVSPSTATGQVQVTTSTGAILGTVNLTGGAGTLALGATPLLPGTQQLTLKYLGDSTHLASTGTASVTVNKAKATLKVKSPAKVKTKAKAKVTVTVKAPAGVAVDGKVKVVIKGTGKSVTAKVKDGKAKLTLPKLKKGTYTLKITYQGSTLLEKAKATATLKVTP